MIEAIIFDMDGVLIDSMKYHISSWRRAFKNHDVAISNEELKLCEGMSYDKTIEFFAKKHHIHFSEDDEREIYEEKKRLLSKILKIRVFPHVLKNLKLLKSKNVKLAVVTGANKEFAQNAIKKHFDGVFDVVVSGDDVKKGKPSPEPYLKALSMLKLTGRDAARGGIIVVENSPLGIESAIKSKLTVLAVETTLGARHLQGANKIFRNHESLFKYMSSVLNK
jgi:HAD superfamily hydrolase (TIGR01509 family)